MSKTRAAEGNNSNRSPNNNNNGPPRLQLHIFDRLKMLLMINIIPIIVGSFLAWNYYQGKIKLRLFEESHGFAALVVLASCFTVGISWWIIIPCAKWLRNYPRWYYRHQSKALWLLPYTCGSLVWCVLWVLCMLAAIIACVAMLAMFYSVFIGVGDPASSQDAVGLIFLP